MEITISRATAADAEDLLRHLKAAGAETDNLSFGKEGVPITVEAEENYLKNLENLGISQELPLKLIIPCKNCKKNEVYHIYKKHYVFIENEDKSIKNKVL